jgi:hypothetical protein
MRAQQLGLHKLGYNRLCSGQRIALDSDFLNCR